MTSDYFEVTKCIYKDLVAVAKDGESGEIKPLTLVYRIEAIKASRNIMAVEHPQNFFYVLVDPQHWHVTLLHNRWTAGW